MPHDLPARLVDLQREFALGEEKLRELDAQQTRLRETMLRIQGAMQMLRELIDAAKDLPSACVNAGSTTGDLTYALTLPAAAASDATVAMVFTADLMLFGADFAASRNDFARLLIVLDL